MTKFEFIDAVSFVMVMAGAFLFVCGFVIGVLNVWTKK